MYQFHRHLREPDINIARPAVTVLPIPALISFVPPLTVIWSSPFPDVIMFVPAEAVIISSPSPVQYLVGSIAIVSSPVPLFNISTPDNVIVSLPVVPVIVFPEELPVRMRLTDKDEALIEPEAVEIMPKVPVPKRFRLVRDPPVLLSVIKLVLLDVIVVVKTPLPAISINKFSLTIDVFGPTSFKRRSKEVSETS